MEHKLPMKPSYAELEKRIAELEAKVKALEAGQAMQLTGAYWESPIPFRRYEIGSRELWAFG